ncbi:MAG TPA: FHA domain-containing protein [Bryobacteraceae bacterium]|nr:FHA domain-containing protein [Bryobacteraceae bacterium]
MKLFSEFEKTIERGFKRWTERVLGKAESDELLLVHRAMLEEIEGKVQVLARGKRVFPFSRVTVTLSSPDAERRTLYQSAFQEGGRLEGDVREALRSAECEMPRSFHVEVKTADKEVPENGNVFAIEYAADEPKAVKRIVEHAPEAAPEGPGRLVVVKGKTASGEYALSKARTNIGRLAELTDAEERVVRRNDVVFEEGLDVANSTVSRRHAHIRLDGGEYRVCDDESEFGTVVFRDGRTIEVPAGNRRGEKLRPGDEIYLGRACLRFERA